MQGVTFPIVPPDNWPTLGEVIQELCDWYYEHHDTLVALKD